MQSSATCARFTRLLATHGFWPHCLRRGTQTQTPRLTKALQRRSVFGESGYILLVIPITAFCLGTWQVRRRKWKLTLIKEMEEKTQSPPIPLPENLQEVAELSYRPVTFRGEFDHSQEMFIGPRSNVLQEGGGLISMSNQTGVNVVTPLKLAGKEETILVNRGWVPSAKKYAKAREEGQVEGEVEVTGIVRSQEKRPAFMPKSDVSSQPTWLYRDVDAMAKKVGAAPVFVDQDLKSSVSGGPLGGQTRITLRNEHLAYIITWYSLSAITFYMWYRRYHRPPPPVSTIAYLKKQYRE